MANAAAASGLLIPAFAPLVFATLINGNFQTQTALYVVIIAVAIGAGTVAGLNVLGVGGDSSLAFIVFFAIALSTTYSVLSAGNLPLLETMPYFALWYTATSVAFILGLILAVSN